MNQFKAGKSAEDIYNDFAKRFETLARDVMGQVVTEYLPHAENDLDSNVYYRAKEYIAGEFKEDTIYGEMGKRFRQRIFEENKEMIINQLNQDNLEKIKELQEEVGAWKKSYYELR